MTQNGNEAQEKIRELLETADAVLLGFGSEFDKAHAALEEIVSAYDRIAQLIAGKPWFAVTVNTDDLIYRSKLNAFFIVAPCGSEKAGNVVTMESYDESAYLPQWQFYTGWLASTLGKKLCILECGVGMEYPTVIRFPFERTALVNQKASLIRIHSRLAYVPPQLQERSVCLAEDPVSFFTKNSAI